MRRAVQTGQCDSNPRDVACDDKCAFGHWLYGPTIDVETRRDLPYKVVRRLHAKFHQNAAHVITLVKKGQLPAAAQMMEGQYTEQSEKLVRALRKWRGEVQAR